MGIAGGDRPTHSDELIRLQAEFDRYRADKETYIAALNQRLARLQHIERARDLLQGGARRGVRGAVLVGKGVRSARRNGVRSAWKSVGQWQQARRSHHAQGEGFDPYTFVHALKPIRITVQASRHDGVPGLPPYTVLTTVRNEGGSIEALIESLATQTLPPAEIIIVDGGSTDDTVPRARAAAARLGAPLRLIEAGPVNIAAGRNIALRAASNELIVLVDGGCKLAAHHCRALIGTFATVPDADLVGGIYSSSSRHTARFIPNWPLLEWDTFIPSARSVAIRRHLAEAAGWFPEYLSKTGEDTWFGVSYRRHSRHWAFNREACVVWDGPQTAQESAALAHSYAFGDGQSGFGDYVIGHVKALSATGDVDPLATGYLEGRADRARIELQVRGVPGVFLVLSGVPFTDSGGGQRGTQLAQALIRAGHKVVFVSVYPSFEEDHKLYFDIDLSLLELVQIGHFDAAEFALRYKDAGHVTVLMEFPHPAFVPIYQRVRADVAHATVVFDYIDNWTSTLGWEWYDEAVETRIMADADLLVASAATLQHVMSTRVGRPVELVANAVNDQVFRADVARVRPTDVPVGPIALYVGAMWGAWFDWDLMEHLAANLRDVSFVFVGTVPEERRVAMLDRHPNVVFVGLKPQTALPDYLAASDVCLIPFTTDHITEFVNPLKVYEYLAMGKRVVSSALPEVRGLPNVAIYDTPDQAVAQVRAALGSADDMICAQQIIETHGWTSRAAALLDAIEAHHHGSATVPTTSEHT